MLRFSSTSTVVTLVQSTGLASFPPRKPTSLGLLGPYDGDVIGGLLLGSGMALSGACPGTVLAQVALGLRSGLWALAGGVAASILWSNYLKTVLFGRSPVLQSCQPTGGPRQDASDEDLTVYGRLGVSRISLLSAFLFICASVIATTVALSLGPDNAASVILGGVSIGLTQLISIFSRDSLLGVSGAYEEVGNWLLWRLQGRGPKTARPRTSKSLPFAAGIAAGSWLLAYSTPRLIAHTAFDVSPVAAFLGGGMMILGATIAGGCTSGHGISGVSLFSVASFVTLCAIFAGGAAIAIPMR
jgi:uncharacterized membrane protein YedE/YeeE